MPDAIRRCTDHGPFAGEACPDCGAAGELVLAGERRRRLSTFVSGALRHFPDDAGLALDERGWTPWADLVAAVERRYDWADDVALAALVATDPKGRFERAGGAGDGTSSDERSESDGGRVRAAYGHSVDVDLADDGADAPVPDTLYHGTAPRNLDAILAEGLKPMSRQQVHLSGSVEEAREVGRRHADDPVVLAVDAAAMTRDGRRVVRRGRGVYTTDEVPPAYLSVDDTGR